MKRKALNKSGKQKISVVQRKLWQICRQKVYERDKNLDGTIDCYTCPAKRLEGSNRQLGHVPWPKAVLGAFLKYDLRCLKYQCYHCNINCGGMGAEAYKYLLEENGEEFMRQLEKDRQVSVNALDHYLHLIELYS